jgi:hypothetical protein
MFRVVITFVFALMLSVTSMIGTAAAKNWNIGKKQEPSNGTSDIKQIIIGDMGKGYEFDGRNVTSKGALKILKHQGMLAAKFHLSLSMGGGDGDWRRGNIKGYAQRFEYGEKQKDSQKLNKEIWTRLLFWLPKETIAKNQVTLFDLKDVNDNQTFGPFLNLALTDEGQGTILKIKHNFEKNDCIIGRDGKMENAFCDKVDVNVIFGPVENFTGKWVDFVSRAVWTNTKQGAYDAWLDGKKVFGYRGKTAIGDGVRFKFGLYRIKLNKTKNPNDVTIYISKAGTASACQKLEINNCEALRQTQDETGYPGALRVFRVNSDEKRKFIAKGGKVLRTF